MIPSMGANDLSAYLRDYALSTPHAIVEVGTWLGAGASHIANALKEHGKSNPIHCYDNFRITKAEAEKARIQGVPIGEGIDTEAIVRRNIDYPNLHLHKGDILNAKWHGGKIGLFIDDTGKSKKHWDVKLREFWPHFIPSHTVIFLQDYYFDKKDMGYCREYMATRDDWELLHDFGSDPLGIVVRLK
jgi:hypothetical protein